MAATKAVIAVFLTIQDTPDQGMLSSAVQRSNCEAYAKIDEYFGFDVMFEAAIGPNKRHLTPAQLAGLKRDFMFLIRRLAYPKSGSLFRSADYQLRGPIVGSDTVDVMMDAYIAEEDIDSLITYHWRQVNGRWRVVDISFDGASLALDYRNQFTRLIREHGVQGFLDKVHRKVVEAQATGEDC